MTKLENVRCVDFDPETRAASRLLEKFEQKYHDRIDLILSRQDDISLGLCMSLDPDHVSGLLATHSASEVIKELILDLELHEEIADKEDNPLPAADVVTLPTANSERISNPLSTVDSAMVAKLSLFTRSKSLRQ